MQLSFSTLGLLVSLTLPTAQLDRCSPHESNVALGELARERVALTATANEIIVGLPVAEGSRVQAGDLLVQLDPAIRMGNLALAKADLANAQANLDKLRDGPRAEEIAIARAEVDGARASLTEAEANFERNSILVEREAITQARLDANRAVRDAARAKLEATQARLLELENGARPEDIAMAVATLAAARARLDVEQTHLDNLAITATRDGVLDSLPWNLGERVTLGSPVAILLAGDRPFARVYVPEPARVKVNEGDELLVSVDGLDEPMRGVVRWISVNAAFTPYYALNQEDRSRLMYLAEIDLPGAAAAALPVGMPAQAHLP